MGSKRLIAAVFAVVIAAILIGTVFISGFINQTGEDKITPADSPVLPSRGFYMGVLPVPGNGQSFEEAYGQAAQYSDFSPVWGRPTPFYNLADDLSGSWGQLFIEGYIRGNGMFPLVHISFIGPDVTLVTPSGLEGATLSDTAWRQAYREAVLDVVRACKPLYLSIGNEVNRWYEKYGSDANDPNGFQNFVSLYEEVYEAVKELSPQSIVFCTFAREVISENREADLSFLSMFDPDRLDLIVLTSYPYAVQGINRPSDIPDGYYSEVLAFMPDKSLGFSELGWPSIEAFGGEEAQAEFITEVVGRLTRSQGITLQLFGWAWLHDLDENDHTGLIERDGTEKMAYEVWKNLYESN